MYGTQTGNRRNPWIVTFENDVKMYGTQTSSLLTTSTIPFENDVKMYGTQTLFYEVQ